MSKHASKPYNPSIANVFYLAGYIESWGRGVEKICQACEEDGIFSPEYTVHPGDIMIKFAAPDDRVVRSTTSKVVDKVSDVEKQILSCLQEYPAYTYIELAQKIGVSKKTIFQKIKSLKEKNIIVRIDSDLKGYWQIIDEQ